MSLAVLTPFDRSPAVELANRTWWKRLLPVGSIEYKGRKLSFTRSYLSSLANAFKADAYDQVPFQMADASNTHTNDPERFRGDIVAMEARPDGLWVGLKPTDAGEKTLLENPRLGVSARIVEDYARSDGKFFPAAIQHVLATLDPRIPGLGPWQAIEAANDVERTIDLTGESFAGEGEDDEMPLDEEQQAKLAKLLEIPADQIDALLAGLSSAQLSDDELAQMDADTDEMSDEALADLLGVPVGQLDEALTAALAEPEAVAAGAGLSWGDEALMALELTAERADQNAIELASIRKKLNEETYLKERRQLADAGVPPYLTDLARPLLEGAGHTVELSSGKGTADAGAIVRKLLLEVGKSAGMLDLGAELGTPMDEPDGHQHAAEARSETVARAHQQLGI